MTDPMLDKLIRFQRPDRALTFTRGLNNKTTAAIFGIDETQYASALHDLDRQRTNAATRLATDPLVRANLKRLPFVEQQHLVAIGESTTADRLSWFEILRTLLQTERPDLGLRFSNLAISGATTTQVLAGLPGIRRQAADWLFCMLGTNDAQRFDPPTGPRLVTANETFRNLRELRARTLTSEAARWVWVTPTPIDEELVATFPYFGQAKISWTNADITELSDWIRTTDDLVIDSAPAIATAGARPFDDDGLHPSLATQEALTAQLIASLAQTTPT
jgi:acyl-CoA thioesterase-1